MKLRLVRALALSTATVAALGTPAAAQDTRGATPFSAGRPGGALPSGWTHVPLNDKKTPTVYALDADGGTVVLRAEARSAVSMVMQAAEAVDLARTPLVRWRWKVGAAPAGADNAVAGKEDAAARLVFVFDGDRERLSLAERTVMRLAETLSGRTMPYATLMYVTSAVAAVDTVVPNPHTGRVQMVVAARIADATGRWQALQRDLVADFRQAFGEAPGRLLAYGVMSDSDNTGTEVRAWYGDIGFAAKP